MLTSHWVSSHKVETNQRDIFPRRFCLDEPPLFEGCCSALVPVEVEDDDCRSVVLFVVLDGTRDMCLSASAASRIVAGDCAAGFCVFAADSPRSTSRAFSACIPSESIAGGSLVGGDTASLVNCAVNGFVDDGGVGLGSILRGRSADGATGGCR